MMQNTLNIFNKDQAELVDHEHQRGINFIARILYCDSGSLSLPRTDEYVTVICVLRDSIEHVLRAVNGLLVRLHKRTCFLLHTKPALLNEANILPDILNDTVKSSKIQCNEGPDLVPIMFRSLTNNPSNTQQPRFLFVTHTSHNRVKHDNCVCSGFDTPNQSNDEYTHCHNHSVSETFRHSQQSMSPVENEKDNLTTTDEGFQSQNSHRSRDTTNKLCFNYHKSDRKRQRTFHISNQISSIHGDHKVNELDQIRVVSDSQSPPIISSSRPHCRKMTSQDNISDSLKHTHDHAVHSVDSDFTRDIVLALRTVGDNLDARMRYNNEPSVHAVFGATKINARWLMLTALRKYYTAGAIASLSLELLQQFNRL